MSLSLLQLNYNQVEKRLLIAMDVFISLGMVMSYFCPCSWLN